MENEKPGTAGSMHSLISLADYKAILGIDDREDVLSRYCLIAATYSIEQYCRRRLYLKKRKGFTTMTGTLAFPILGKYEESTIYIIPGACMILD
jgi:hypothetical protein